MKIAIAFLLLAVCFRLGSGQEQYVKYSYYEKSASGGYGDQPQISTHETEMFAFTFQGLVCLVGEVKKGPAQNKPAAYKSVVENLIRVVETYANSRGVASSQLFSNKVELDFYLELKALAASGDYSNVARVENTVDGVCSSFGKVLGDVLQSLGMVVEDVLKTVTGILGSVTGGVLGGVTGGVLGTLTGALGGVTGGGGGGLLGRR